MLIDMLILKRFLISMDKSVVLQRERNHPKCCGGG
ncbi:hypothetical protein YPPY101_1693, partial [Yersinia pestis PY-101]